MKKLCEKEKQEVLEDLGHLLRPTFEFTQLSKETGEIDGYKYMIRPSGVCTCAYIKIPKGHPWYTEDEEFHPSNGPEIPVNGGCTFYEYFPEDKDDWTKGCWVGWDYGHIENDGVSLTKGEVIEDIKAVIKTAKEVKNEI